MTWPSLHTSGALGKLLLFRLRVKCAVCFYISHCLESKAHPQLPRAFLLDHIPLVSCHTLCKHSTSHFRLPRSEGSKNPALCSQFQREQRKSFSICVLKCSLLGSICAQMCGFCSAGCTERTLKLTRVELASRSWTRVRSSNSGKHGHSHSEPRVAQTGTHKSTADAFPISYKM